MKYCINYECNSTTVKNIFIYKVTKEETEKIKAFLNALEENKDKTYGMYCPGVDKLCGACTDRLTHERKEGCGTGHCYKAVPCKRRV